LLGLERQKRRSKELCSTKLFDGKGIELTFSQIKYALANNDDKVLEILRFDEARRIPRDEIELLRKLYSDNNGETIAHYIIDIDNVDPIPTENAVTGIPESVMSPARLGGQPQRSPQEQIDFESTLPPTPPYFPPNGEDAKNSKEVFQFGTETRNKSGQKRQGAARTAAGKATSRKRKAKEEGKRPSRGAA